MPCDAAVDHALPSPDAVPGDPIIVTGRTASGGVDLSGARIVWLSQAPMSAWQKVLAHPELADDWSPPALGIQRVDRLDEGHIYQKNDFNLLGGLVRIQRQAVVAIRWEAATAERFANCWWVEDHGGWPVKDDGSEFVEHGQGSWKVEAVPGGSAVSYAFWAEARLVPPQIQAWVMSRILPEFSRAFEAHVRAVAATP